MINLFNYESENENAERYGRYYWGIVLADGRYIYLHADSMEVSDAGDILALRKMDDDEDEDSLGTQITLSVAKGQWLTFFAANLMNGNPVSIDNTKKYE